MRAAREVGIRLVFAALAAVLGTFFALPLVWLVLAPWNARAELAVTLPSHPTLANFQAVFGNEFAVRALGNSVILAVSTMVVVTLAATLAAYALSRSRIPHYEVLTYALILFSSVVTGTAAIVPIFLLANTMGLIDTHAGAILAFTGGFLPAAIFILRDFVEGLPRSYEEASYVLGASAWQTFRYVVVPLLRPGMVVVGIWTFVNVWGAFLIPFVIIRTPNQLPASIAVYSFYTEAGLPILTLTSAYALLYAIPVVVLYLVANWRYGFRFFGGLKG